MNQDKLQKFQEAYYSGLLSAVNEHPEQYLFKLKSNQSLEEMIKERAQYMCSEICKNPFIVQYSGHGFKNACKILGIKYTRKAILEFLQTD